MIRHSRSLTVKVKLRSRVSTRLARRALFGRLRTERLCRTLASGPGTFKNLGTRPSTILALLYGSFLSPRFATLENAGRRPWKCSGIVAVLWRAGLPSREKWIESP